MSHNEQIALRINESLHRFPLILDILEEIHQSRHVGDEDLKHGSHRAIQSMLDSLRKIPMAHEEIRQSQETRKSSKSATEPTIAEQIAGEWLLGERPKTLLPAPNLSEMESLIYHLLPGLRRHPKNFLESPDPREQAS